VMSQYQASIRPLFTRIQPLTAPLVDPSGNQAKSEAGFVRA
jgi:hypothetical protein